MPDSPAASIRERRAAHTDAERDAARARLRVAADNYRRVAPPYQAAVAERAAAALHGWEVGLTVREMGEVTGSVYSNVNRWLNRARGSDETRRGNVARRRRLAADPDRDPYAT